MQLRNSVNNVETQIDGTNDFTIKTSTKAFKILSDNLYADKYSAVIREYSTNAYDAHVAAGCPNKPFEVHLPSLEETWFSVRDFGIGMSDEFIKTLFTSYFDSDKSESNDYIGALGLGSKSAFAYTDSFVVESIYNGVYRSYVCFISEEGTPKISCISEEETKEHNGVIIKFNVKQEDIEEFQKKAGGIYRFFKIHPIMTGLSCNLTQEEKTVSGNGWYISNIERWNNFSKTFAIQGNIAYPIDIDRLTGTTSRHRFIIENSFRIDFELGELDVAASREDISYDTQTIENIKNKLDHVFSEFFDKIAHEIRQENSEWMASKHFYKMLKQYNLREGWIFLPIIYNGKPLQQTFDLDTRKYPEIDFFEYKKHYSQINRKDLKGKYYKTSFLPSEDIILVFQDEDSLRICQSKARSLVYHNNTVILINSFNQEIIDDLGGIDYKFTSQIEKPKPQKRAVSQSQQHPFLPMKDTGFFLSNKALNFSELPELVYYIPINRYKPVDNKTKMDNRHFAQIIQDAKILGILKSDDIIYGTLGWAVRKYTNSDQFINVLEYIRQKMDSSIKKKIKQIESYRKATIAIDEWEKKLENKELYNAYKEGLIFIGSEGKLQNIFSKVERLKKRIDKYKENQKFHIINNLVSQRGFEIKVEHQSIPNVSDYYPMIKFFGYSFHTWRYNFNDSDAKIIQDYINFIDGNK